MIVRSLFLVLALTPLASLAQKPPSATDQTLQQALKNSMLTYDGKSFHAVLEITPGTGKGHEPPPAGFTGRVEVWWASSNRYRVSLISPEFSQERTVNGDDIEEKDTGQFLPRWLESFVRVLTDPVPVSIFNSDAGAFMMGGDSGGFSTQSCIRRDDRANGITDQMTWGQVCFDGSKTLIDSVTTFNYSIYMKDWKSFEDKQIARSYEVFALDRLSVIGKMTTLERLSATDQSRFVLNAPTRKEDRIETTFVSTVKAESLIDRAPKIKWPAVREGKTDGYMIVYARTDRTGQVRETATRNSDNPGLEEFGMQQALNYKFKPLVQDGIAEQMEMPLVLHISSRIENVIPLLSPKR